MTSSVQLSFPRSVCIFCRVIDNFGDIGVAWRLARQLSLEQSLSVSLIVDALGVFEKICPLVDVTQPMQSVGAIAIGDWKNVDAMLALGENVADADLVIEAFGCGLPEAYLQGMITRAVRPIWINLEYLSAESWIDSYHGLCSRHPTLPLVTYFYFPGLTTSSGGLLRERELLNRRDVFQTGLGRSDFFRQLDIASWKCIEPSALVISLFCYESAPVSSWLTMLEQADRKVVCLIPEAVASSAVQCWLGAPATVGACRTVGQLTVEIISMIEQDRYDQLLWACDVNFVRGEDSLVRAIWAGRPFIWHIYSQDENGHLVKLDAFVERYIEKADPVLRTTLKVLFDAWNGQGSFVEAWFAATGQRLADRQSLAQKALPAPDRLPAWQKHASEWSRAQAENQDLATGLLQIARKFG